MAKSYLNDVYDGGTNDSRELYASWASTYDNEVQKNGYVTPERVAKALKDIVTNQSEVILDYGCGTGLSGSALQAVGFTNIDGLDVSQEMVTLAEKKSIYKTLTVFDPSAKIPVHADQYKIITAIGVIGAEQRHLKFSIIYFLYYRQVDCLLFHSMTTHSVIQITRKK